MISVITPVYNNKDFIERSIASAHEYTIVKEILVIEDGGTDGTYDLLMQLKKRYPKIIVLTHPGRENRGIAKSRNLGIRHATSEWISFLDSDDYYLNSRFDMVEEIIKSGSTIDGIFEPVINRVFSQEGEARFNTQKGSLDSKIIEIRNHSVTPFEAMFYGKGGVVHLDGLTIRRSLAMDVGLFDENLRIVDDSVFRIKVAFKGKLVAGSKEPVAVRTIHEHNNEPNIKPADLYNKQLALVEFFLLSGAKKLIVRQSIRRTLQAFINYRGSHHWLLKYVEIVGYLLRHPRYFVAYLSW